MINAATVLGVDPWASQKDIQRAYRSLAAIHHPDVPGGSADKMKLLNEAYTALKAGSIMLPSQMSEQELLRERMRFERELRIVEQKLRNVDATVKLWAKDDNRIPKMRGPLEEREKFLREALAALGFPQSR